MTVTAKIVFNPKLGRRVRGKCFICKENTYNYRYDRFRTLWVSSNEKDLGYAHQACYEDWNPKIGNCVSCNGRILQRSNYHTLAGSLYCQKCYNLKEKKEEHERLERIQKIKENAIPIIKTTCVSVVVPTIPIVREVYLCYSIGKVLYPFWNSIYTAYQESEKLDSKKVGEATYNMVRYGAKTGLTSYQTEMIWNKIEKIVPEDIKYEAKEFLTDIVSNVSEEEIKIVEQTLGLP